MATDTIEQQVEGFTERLFGSASGFIELATLHLGKELGLYDGLAKLGAATAPTLSAETGTAERYVREWLEQQAVIGILTVDDETAGPAERRYSLPEAHRIVLLEERNLAYLGMLGLFVPSFGKAIPDLVEAFRTGDGVPWEAYGHEMVVTQEAFNRPSFLNLLAQEWIPKIPDVHERLQAGGTVADIACGAGWSSIAIAKGFPNVTVHGYDLDEASIALARRNAEDAGVSDRVRFDVSDASSIDGHYDVAFILEALHDMTRPVDVLRTVKGIIAPGASLIVMDENVADRFTMTPESPMEGFFYGASVLLCLPNGLVGEDPAGTGTVIRESTVRTYATEAGFETVEVLPIEHPMFRFYRLL